MAYTPEPIPSVLSDDWLAKSGYMLGYWSARSKFAHLMNPNFIDGSMDALCGRVGGYIGVQPFGTGTQDEYERARRLPLCRRCAHIALFVPDGAAATRKVTS